MIGKQLIHADGDSEGGPSQFLNSQIPNKSELLPLLHSDMKLIEIAGQSILKFHFVWTPALGMLLSHFLWPGPLKVPQNAAVFLCLAAT